ncbi:MAG: prefoldin subunit alpha [Nitrososphaerales archaeon]
MSEEEKLQALVAEMKMIEAYLNDIFSREATISRLIEEGRLAIDAIKNISGSDQVQTLMPIGIGVYMQAYVTPVDKLLLSVGSGVAIEKSKDDAVNYIESRTQELEVALRTMVSQKQELATKMEQTKAQINAIMQKFQQKSG